MTDAPRPEVRGAEQPLDEMRCQTCISLAVECPHGYAVMSLKCDVCTYTTVWVQPDCIEEEPQCPRCDGSMSMRDLDEKGC